LTGASEDADGEDPTVTATVLRAYGDVDPAFLTEVLRAEGWIGDAAVVAAPAETVGAGLMGICARYELVLDREVPGAPRSVIGKFAAQDATARDFMASSGYRNELCFYQHFATQLSVRAPRCAHAAIDDDGWFTLVLEDCAPMEPGDQLQGCTLPQVEAAVLELVGLHAPLWDDAGLEAHGCFADPTGFDPEALGAALQVVVPGFVDRYGAALAPDEVAFYERFAQGAGNWFAARAPRRTLVHSDYRPDNLLFSPGPMPSVAVVDWQGFGRGCALSDVSFLIGNALASGVRRAEETRLVGAYHDALVAAGVSSYPFDECWDEYACSLLSSLMTTIFGAMYGLRTDRGDRMFELMGARHARQILDLGADRFLEA
jgi:aminoglycoside/choline kinase family phosphotransferase